MFQCRMEIYREVCAALERLYERSSEAPGSESSPLRPAQAQPGADAMLTLTPADANYQVALFLSTYRDIKDKKL